MNINATNLMPKWSGPELDLSNTPLNEVEDTLKDFMGSTPAPYRIYTDMTDESADLVRQILDDAYDNDGILWSRWGHNVWKIRPPEST